MTSAFDDEDLALSINPSHTRRGSARSPSDYPPRADPMHHATQSSHQPILPVANKRLGQYNIIRTLGQGSFGKVKLAEHVISGQEVALKIINREKLQQRDMVGRIEREVQYLQLLRHPHIIKLYNVIPGKREIVMVLEYAGGELFNYLVEHGKLPDDKARAFFQQIVSAVEYCHRHKIVHRDLKPENLLLDENMNIKIADFGLSNIITDGNFLKTSCGSPNYAAPEVISGQLYAGPEVDVWSCGIILYVLLVGRLPFDHDHVPTLFKKINAGKYHVPQYMSKGAANLIHRILQVDVVVRITIQEIGEDPWFKKNMPEYLKPPTEDFLDTGVDPNKPIDPKALAPSQPIEVVEKIHDSVVGKLSKTLGYGQDDVQQQLSLAEPNVVKDAYLMIRENQIKREIPTMNEEPALQSFFAQSPEAAPQSSMANITEKVELPKPSSKPSSSEQRGHHEQRPHSHRLSTEVNTKLQARSPGGRIAVLPSSMPEYHKMYMAGQPEPGKDDAPKEDEQLTREVRKRRLNPHSRSQINTARQEKPDSTTPHPAEKKKTKATKWQFGIRSRNPPNEAMLAIYRALQAMGADWEVPTIRTPGDFGEGNEAAHEAARSAPSIDGSSDESDGNTSCEEGRARRDSSSTSSSSTQGKRKRKRYGPYNDYGYKIPVDPYIINARFRKGGMLSPDSTHPTSASASRLDLTDVSATQSPERQGSGSQNSGRASSDESPTKPGKGVSGITTALAAEKATSAPTSNPASHTSSPSTSAAALDARGQFHPEAVDTDDSAYVFITIQLYALGNKEQEMYVVDFKCAGYERLIRKLVRTVGGDDTIDSVHDLNDTSVNTTDRSLDPEQPLEETGHEAGDNDDAAYDSDTERDRQRELGRATQHSECDSDCESDSDSEAEREREKHEQYASSRPTEGGNWDELKRRHSQRRRSETANRSREGSSAHASGPRTSKSGSTASRDFAPEAVEEGGKSPEGAKAGGGRLGIGNFGASMIGMQKAGLGDGRNVVETFVGHGRAMEEKDISSPFPFLDVASRLIIQLAEAN